MLSPKMKPFGMNFAPPLFRCICQVSQVVGTWSSLSSDLFLSAAPLPPHNSSVLFLWCGRNSRMGGAGVHVSVYSTRSGSTGTLPTIVRACYAILVPQIMMLFRPNQFHHWLQISRTWKALKMEGDGDQRANHHSPLNRKISFPKVSPIECLTFNNLGLHNNEWHHPNIVHQIPE